MRCEKFGPEPLPFVLHLAQLHLAQRIPQWIHRRFRLLRRDARLQPRHNVQPPGSPLIQIVPARRNLRLHHHGREYIRRIAHNHAPKSRRRDAHHRERMVIQTNSLIQHARIAAKAPLPVAIAQHCNGVGFGRDIVGLLEHPAQRRPHAEQLKIVPRYQLSDSTLGLAVPVGCDLVKQSCKHSAEDRIAVAQVAIHGIREIQPALIARSQRSLVPASKMQHLQLLRRLHRQRPQQHLIEQSEDSCIGPDPKGQRKNRHQRKARALQKCTNGISQHSLEIRRRGWPNRWHPSSAAGARGTSRKPMRHQHVIPEVTRRRHLRNHKIGVLRNPDFKQRHRARILSLPLRKRHQIRHRHALPQTSAKNSLNRLLSDARGINSVLRRLTKRTNHEKREKKAPASHRHLQQTNSTSPAPSPERPAPSAQPRAPSPERPAPSAQPRAPSPERPAPSAQPRAPSPGAMITTYAPHARTSRPSSLHRRPRPTPRHRLHRENPRIHHRKFFSTELVDHLPASDTVPTPEKVLGYIVGAPNNLTYTKDIYRYMRELEKATQRVKVFTIGKLRRRPRDMLVAVSDEANIAKLDHYNEINARLADPRKTSAGRSRRNCIAEDVPMYWASGSIHSPETGSPEMLMELAYRLAVEDSPLIQNIRKNSIVLITPGTEVDGRDREVDVYNYHKENPSKPAPQLVYWGKYVAHDNNRDGLGMALALSRDMMTAFLEFHPTVLHDLHESVPFLYVSTGMGPYNAWLDPLVVDEWQKMAYVEIEEMTKRGVPGVWTHGFYDGWAPNYMFYVANGHNSIGRFYETFGGSGADTGVRTVPATATSRTWFRPNPPLPRVNWSLRDNINLQESAILFAMNYTANNRKTFLDNFYLKSKRSVEKAAQRRPCRLGDPRRRSAPRQRRRPGEPARMQGVEVNRLNADADVSVKQGNEAKKIKIPARQLRGPHGSALQPHGRHAARHPVLQHQ